jgi:proteic killer suppression protein
MIVGFRDNWLWAFFAEDVRSRNIPPDLESRVFRKLQMIDDAATDQDLRVPPSNHFEKLRGKLADFHSIRVNQHGGSFSSGTAPGVRQQRSILTTIATNEVRGADDETQTGKRRRNSG